jgi:hypothetical protein
MLQHITKAADIHVTEDGTKSQGKIRKFIKFQTNEVNNREVERRAKEKY